MDEQTPAERQLTEHHDAGRLDDDDYRLRMARARLATSRAELDDLFADLPGGYDDTPDNHQWPVLGGQPAAAPTWRNPPTSQPSPYVQPASTSSASSYAEAFPEADPNAYYTDPVPASPYGSASASSAGVSWRQAPPAQPPEVPVVVPPSPTPARTRDNRQLASTIRALAWPVCIGLMLITKSWWWILVAIFVVPLVVNALRNNNRN